MILLPFFSFFHVIFFPKAMVFLPSQLDILPHQARKTGEIINFIHPCTKEGEDRREERKKIRLEEEAEDEANKVKRDQRKNEEKILIVDRLNSTKVK